jgi:hypothetical protein
MCASPTLRMSQAALVIRTHLVGGDTSLPPGGVGAPPVPTVALALANAISPPPASAFDRCRSASFDVKRTVGQARVHLCLALSPLRG